MPSAPPANPLNLLHPDLAPAGARFNPLVLNTMANKSPNPMHEPPLPSRKVHVVYYLSRSGQLEHPHLLEVSISPNEGLYLRDVKKRLAMIRGKRLSWTFAWSYKRSYKNGYVWQDLCDDDLIFPAHGCEYVLKGSEILTDSNAEKCQHTPSAATLDAQSGSKEEQGLISINPKLVYRNYEESAVNSTTLQKSMVESGTDAATQTEEELRLQEEEEEQQQAKGLFINHDLARNQSLSHSTGESCRPQNATELNKADIASPPSSSSTNSPSPYKNMATTSTSSSTSVIKAANHNNNINPAVTDEKINDNINGSKTPGRSWMKRAVQKLEKQDEIICQIEGGINSLANIETPGKMKYSGIGNGAMVDSEPPSARPSRGKHSGAALSLLQFVSCGGLDIKEQILPMSLYRLRSKGTPTGEHSMVSSEDLCEVFSYGGSEGNKSWTKLGRTKNYHSIKPCKSSDGYGVYDEDNHYNHNHNHSHRRHHHQGDSVAISLSPAINRRSAKARSASIPDVISIGRSSISDRSTNVSRELEYHMTKPHGKLKKSGEMINVKGSPSFSRELFLDCRNAIMDSPRSVRAVSGEIMSKGSPLFVPGKQYINGGSSPSGRPSSILNTHSNEGNLSTKLDPQKPSSTTTSRAFSEGEVSSMLAKSNPNIQTGEKPCNGYDRSMVQLWEELLAPPAKEGDYQRPQITATSQAFPPYSSHWPRTQATGAAPPTSGPRVNSPLVEYLPKVTTKLFVAHLGTCRRQGMADSELDRERTLQNAVDLSLPPVELLVLQECPHCCRKVKPELLKSHMKNCSWTKSNNKCNNHNSNSNMGEVLGKPPKPDSNLCQRFLRASPPPTK